MSRGCCAEHFSGSVTILGLNSQHLSRLSVGHHILETCFSLKIKSPQRPTFRQVRAVTFFKSQVPGGHPPKSSQQWGVGLKLLNNAKPATGSHRWPQLSTERHSYGMARAFRFIQKKEFGKH